MAAVIVPSHRERHADRPSSAPEARPALRVIHGGRSARQLARRRVYRRRRLVAGIGLLMVVRSLVGEASPALSPASSSAATAAVPPAAAEAYVVQPGDTLWSIAAQLPHGGDVRALVDELADRAGGPRLQTGQRIDLAGLGS
jgi:hypothetical protein